MKIGIYGGAFDPPHLGHARAASVVCDRLSLDRLYIVPAFFAPLKNGSVATPKQRLEMCRLAFADARICVSDYEINKGGVSYTADTLSYFCETHPSCRPYLIIGTDQLCKLGKWHNPESIFASADIAVVTRDSGVDALPADMIREYEKQGARFVFIDNPVTEVSSTEIRNGEKHELLDESVKEYIKEHGLYKF